MLNINITDQVPFTSFAEASRSTLRYLSHKYGFGAWMMTRKNDDEWVILQIEGEGYQIDEMSVLSWSDSICSRMVKGQGPRWVADVNHVEVYKNAPIYSQQPIRAYVGIPVCYPNGDLFGTLCAIDPTPTTRIPVDGQDTVELISKLLSSLLQLELQNITLTRRQIDFLPEQLKDSQTGFLNRLGWSVYLEKEQSNIQATGAQIHIIALDVARIEPPHRKQNHMYALVASIIKMAMSEDCYVARLSDEIFTLLVADLSTSQVEMCISKIAGGFDEAGIKAAIGYKKHGYQGKLDTTVMGAIKDAKCL
ncbi:hypothetical protein FCU94_19395 [Vibrio sp. JPW-9-11-11]|uniref:GAF domain-containing protein n=1 Tax=Vibrio sp. JPW-9-11-11 TaxID=1416532 RepID=UPI00159410D5|nr:GAF domain-containing protein [Vibrio sp. JPW-9-11-11]NVD09017.1 hypothetical protein [Vibrio sp. JPW-9-11-11]